LSGIEFIAAQVTPLVQYECIHNSRLCVANCLVLVACPRGEGIQEPSRVSLQLVYGYLVWNESYWSVMNKDRCVSLGTNLAGVLPSVTWTLTCTRWMWYTIVTSRFKSSL